MSQPCLIARDINAAVDRNAIDAVLDGKLWGQGVRSTTFQPLPEELCFRINVFIPGEPPSGNSPNTFVRWRNKKWNLNRIALINLFSKCFS